MTIIASQTGRAHLLLISKTPGVSGGALGVVTLEGKVIFQVGTAGNNNIRPIFIDIIEEIIAEEIVDEFDRYEDNQSKNVARRRTTAAIMRG